MSAYEWKVVEDSFVLYRDGEATDTYVSYRRGGWQVYEDGRFLWIDAHTPSEAMDSTNEANGIEAPYDAETGRLEIIRYLESDVDGSLGRVSDYIFRVQNDINTLSGVRNYVTFSIGYDAMYDESQTAYDILHKLKGRFDYLERNIFNLKRWKKDREES